MLWLVVMVLLRFSPESSTASDTSMAREGCKSKCGGITVPFPFGMADDDRCFLKGFDLTCDETDHTPKLYLGNVNLSNTGNVEVLHVDLTGLLRVNQRIARQCFDDKGNIYNSSSMLFNMNGQRPYTFSDTWNKFVAIGCDTIGYFGDQHGNFWTGCVSLCNHTSIVVNDTCSGIGCCQTNVPKGLSDIQAQLRSFNNHIYCHSFSPCSYAFLTDNTFVFNASILMDFQYTERLPVSLEWAVGNQTCEEAKRNSSGYYACVDEQNALCENSTNGQGYRCKCKEGYQGNAYLKDGCQDINECDLKTTQCSHNCTNLPGTYNCTCPKGMHGDGRKNGTGCIHESSTDKTSRILIPIGIVCCVLFLIFSISWLYWIIRKRNLIQLREKFFRRNGGLLLEQKISPAGSFESAARIFTLDELRKATNNFDDSFIIGKGGFGTVYKGVLLDTRVVAIKKSKISDQEQVEQFINEVVVLSNIIHRNVVKLLGCCLESEVPLLVYEFMANGTLSEHLHEGNRMKLPLEMRIRIAAESAEALAYLHSSASTPIIHRDIKTSNILLDENYTSKVSDFGTSRLVPFDRSCVNSLVRGTFGYLDPEYLHTGQFTDKSDVYSFGIVLVELLTGEKAISKTKFTRGNGNLANCFISCMNENRLSEILDRSMEIEGSIDKILEVAKLAKRCLQLKGDDRPTMRVVAMALNGLESQKKHPWIKEKNELVQPFVEPLLLSDQTTSYAGDRAYGEADASYSTIVPFNIMR